MVETIEQLDESTSLDLKIRLLTEGLDVDAESIRQNFPDIQDYKVNNLKVSDRHFAKPGSKIRYYIPDELMLHEDGKRSVVKVYYTQNSRLMLSHDGEDLIISDKNNGDKTHQAISLLKKSVVHQKEIEGSRLSEYVSVVGLDKVSVIPYDGCSNWVLGNQCKFCGANPKRLGFTKGKPNVIEIGSDYGNNISGWWNHNRENSLAGIREGIAALLSDPSVEPHFHLMFMAGNLIDVNAEWDILLDIIGSVAADHDIYRMDSSVIAMPPADFSKVSRAHDLGISNIAFNMECYDHETFKEVCPGKEEMHGYHNMIRDLERCVDIYGAGNVRTNFVLGSERIETLKQGVMNLASKGIVSDYSTFFPRPASGWANRSPTEKGYLIEFSDFVTEVYLENGFKPYACEVSSRSSIANEVYNQKNGDR
ncbi:MAG: hypothetical protein KKE20_01105 [Nanoarchaeota archaeon]|nr:hypothetical protein [Nanoarchaeota archaeon]